MRPRARAMRNQHKLKDVKQTCQQNPKSSTAILTWHLNKYKVHKFHQRYILKVGDWSLLGGVLDVFRVISSLVCKFSDLV